MTVAALHQQLTATSAPRTAPRNVSPAMIAELQYSLQTPTHHYVEEAPLTSHSKDDTGKLP